MPSANWIAAATQPDARPIYVYQIPALSIYFASEAGHYTSGFTGSNKPHHAGIIAPDGLPTIERSIQNLFFGRTVSTIGAIKLIDDGSLDAYFFGYTSSLRGQILYGYVTYEGLADTDVENYLTARIVSAESDSRDLTINLVDYVGLTLEATRLAAGTYTSTALSTVVQARLAAGGLTYPTDYDTTAWTAWAALAGAYVVTGSWSEGKVLDIVDSILAETLTWYMIGRDGKFYIEQFADLGGSPSVDVDLTGANDIYDGRNSTSIYEPVFRSVTVKYNAGSSSVTDSVNASVSSGYPNWYAAAYDGEPKDCGLDAVGNATTLAAARLALLSAEHAVSIVDADARMLGYDLGSTVQMDLGDKKLPDIATQYHRVIGIAENPNVGKTTLTLWTLLGATPT